jgi:hypothetical protein
MNIRIRIALLTTLLVMLVAPLAQAGGPIVRSHVLTMEIDEQGIIQPYSHYLRSRELTPRTEEELQAVVAAERKAAPSETGRLAVRAMNAKGEVIYRTLADVPLVRHTHATDGEVTERLDRPVFTVIVPETAASISLEGWEEVWRATFDVRELAAKYGEAAPSSSRFESQQQQLPTVRLAENRFTMLFLGDGYTAAEEALFRSDVTALQSTFFGFAPYSVYRPFIGTATLFQASTDSGAVHPPCPQTGTKSCDPLEGVQTTRNTVYSARYCHNNIQRSLVVNQQAVTNTINAQVEGGNPDVVVVLVNDSLNGGTRTGNVTTVSVRQPNHPPHPANAVNPYAGLTVAHETAHATGLSDEYDDRGIVIGPPPYCNGNCGINVQPAPQQVPALADIKWARWIDVSPPAAVPICTDAQQYTNNVRVANPCAHLAPNFPVGLYEGAGYYRNQVYRSQRNCLMRTIDTPGEFCAPNPVQHRPDTITTNPPPFCHICAETIIRRLYAETDPLENIRELPRTNPFTPAAHRLAEGETIILGADVVLKASEPQKIVWRRNGVVQPLLGNVRLVPYTGVRGQTVTMEMAVLDETAAVRDRSPNHTFGALAKPLRMSRSIFWTMTTPVTIAAGTNGSNPQTQNVEITVPQGARNVQLRYAVNTQEVGDTNRPGDSWGIVVAYGGTTASATTTAAPPLFSQQDVIKSSSQNFERLISIPVDTTAGDTKVVVTVRIRNLESDNFVDSRIEAEVLSETIESCGTMCEVCTRNPSTPGCPLTFKQLKAEMLPHEPDARNRGDGTFVSIARAGMEKLDTGRHVRLETSPLPYSIFKQMDIYVYVMTTFSEELALVRKTTWKNDGSRTGGSKGMERVVQDGSIWKLNVSQKGDFFGDSLLANIPEDKWPFEFKYRIKMVVSANDGRSTTSEIDVATVPSVEPPFVRPLHALRKEDQGNNIEGIWHRWTTIHAHRWFNQHRGSLHRADRIADEHAVHDTPVGHERATAFTEVPFYPGAGVWTNSAGTAILRPYWNFRSTAVGLANNQFLQANRDTLVRWVRDTRSHLETLVQLPSVMYVRVGDGSTPCESPLFRPNDILPEGFMRQLLEFGRVTKNGVVMIDLTNDVGAAQWQPTFGYRIVWGCEYNYYYDVELDRCRIGELPGPCTTGRPPGMRITRIRTQPAGASINVGQSATLAVEAEGEDLRYRWYAGPSGNFTESRTVTGGDLPTLKVTPPETQQYWVYVWGGYGSATSDAALVQVAGTGTGPCKAPSVTQQPQLITYLDPETSTSLSVTATGTNLTYQWYYAATVDAPFQAIPGATSREYTLASAPGRYHVRVQNSCGTVFSNSCYIVLNTSCAVPVITSKTLDRRVTLGDFFDLSVTATGKAPLTYSWTERTPDGATRFIGATATLRVYPEIDGTQYIPTVGNECKYTTGDPVTISVCYPPNVTEHPQSKNLVRGESVTLSVAANGSAPLTVTWIDGDSKTVGTGLSATFAPQVTTTYYARVSNSCGQVTSFGALVTVCHPPTITTPPQGANITGGQSATLTVVAGGTGPHTYQWFANGAKIDGATSQSLSVTPDVTTTYHVVVTGTCGNISSSTATINVCHPPRITRQPVGASINAGQQVTLSVDASGTAPLTYTLLDQDNNQIGSGASNSFTFFAAIPAGGTRRYRIQVSGGCGSPVVSSEVTISVCAPPAISQQPQSVSIVEGDSTTLSVTATGSEPLSYQWYQGSTAMQGENGRTLTVAPLSFTTYSVKVSNACAEVMSASANVTVTLRCIRPFITTQPASSTITAGQSVPLTVVVGGSTPRSFQWYANGAAISGAVQQTYNAAPSATTSYHVVVQNDCGTATSDTAVITVESCDLPVINTHPQPVTIQSGETASLSVAASGAATYQWYANGSAISGATSSSYNASPATSTTYHVVVGNSCGSVSSNSATVTVGVCAGASITAQPQSISITSGQATTLRVTANGTAPFSYQWYENGAAVSGATGSSYTVTPTATTSYYVVVSNSCGNVTSATATVAVNCAIPVINFQPQSSSIEPGQTVTLTVGASGLQPFSYQWYANGSPVGNTISSSLTVSPGSTTNYHVVVSNACGSSTSNTATITVATCLPANFTKRANDVSIAPGETTTLAVQASGTGPISYIWRDQNDNVVGNGTSINVAPATSTTYSVRIANNCGSDVDHVTVSVVDCPLPVITVHPKSFSMTEGGKSFYEVVATSSSTLSYQWFANGVAMPGKTSRAIEITPTVTTSYFVEVTNSCGTVRSETGTVTVNPCTKPVFTTQPRSVTIVDGEAATLSAAASGTGPITYTLLDQDRNTVDSNTTGVFSVRPPVLAPYEWGYWISAANACGVIFSEGVSVTVLAACTPPSISSQPQSATIMQGESTTLSLSASGSSPLNIRWFTSGGQQIGSGNSVNVSPQSTTSYYATVSNSCGERQSTTVTVTVSEPCEPPSISAPVEDTFVLLRYGFTKTLAVSASGSGLKYQWYQSVPAGSAFVAMPGKTGSSLAVSPGEDTNFRVRVSNDCGEVTSAIWIVKMWDGIGDAPNDPRNQ